MSLKFRSSYITQSHSTLLTIKLLSAEKRRKVMVKRKLKIQLEYNPKLDGSIKKLELRKLTD